MWTFPAKLWLGALRKCQLSWTRLGSCSGNTKEPQSVMHWCRCGILPEDAVSVCVCVCVGSHGGQQRASQGIRFPKAGVTSGCEPSIVCARKGTLLWSSEKAASISNPLMLTHFSSPNTGNPNEFKTILENSSIIKAFEGFHFENKTVLVLNIHVFNLCEINIYNAFILSTHTHTPTIIFV